jgi:signal transduction histidine kinase
MENARLFEQAKLLIATEERNRLARELHDSVAQALFSISLYSDASRRALTTNRLEAVRENLDELTQLSREALADMRLLIFELRPPVIEESGLVAALQTRLDSVESRAGFHTHLEMEGEFQLTQEQESELYRIAQEALNNVLKHAHAEHVVVTLKGEPGRFRMSIEDNGVGFDLKRPSRLAGRGCAASASGPKKSAPLFSSNPKPDMVLKLPLR